MGIFGSHAFALISFITVFIESGQQYVKLPFRSPYTQTTSFEWAPGQFTFTFRPPPYAIPVVSPVPPQQTNTLSTFTTGSFPNPIPFFPSDLSSSPQNQLENRNLANSEITAGREQISVNSQPMESTKPAIVELDASNDGKRWDAYSLQYTTSHCDHVSRQRINQCSWELIRYGVFDNSNHTVEKLTLQFLRSQTRENFIRICGAYKRYTQCIGQFSGQACYSDMQFNRTIASTDAALRYACGSDFRSMLAYWYCYEYAFTESSRVQCDAHTHLEEVPPTNVSDSSDFDAVCRTLNDHFECIRKPIVFTCGKNSWNVLEKIMQAAVRSRMPACQVSLGCGLSAIPAFVFVSLFGIVFH
ncbi:hypothetical protein AB6A40_001214 [Gnathostoma spinigerum]|uniref:Uncharacterized protein n=1 Tax=Gnathostoma spinigerum TaxID=75299 RepID=A0ABD6EDV5_9BILA